MQNKSRLRSLNSTFLSIKYYFSVSRFGANSSIPNASEGIEREIVDVVQNVTKKAAPEGAAYYGGLGRIRTPDPLIRSQVLYPTELPIHCEGDLARLPR
jgi:hypothetical protein